jgi:hypothetical protein
MYPEPVGRPAIEVIFGDYDMCAEILGEKPVESCRGNEIFEEKIN